MRNNNKDLTLQDYKNILQFYHLPYQGSFKHLKRQAENILATKLCRCIKKVGSLDIRKEESKAIGICSRTILQNKGLTKGKFKCKGKRTITLKKRNK